MKRSFVVPIIEKVARDLGVEVHIEPWGFVGVLVLRDGRKRYFRGASFDLNTLGSSEVARDKDYAAYFLKQFGYPVPEGKTFFSESWAEVVGSDQRAEAACAYAETLGWPVIVKPNSRSQGRGVAKAWNAQELRQAIEEIEPYENVYLVQKVVPGRDYRIVVLDGEVISAYERKPLSVVGDGELSVRELLVEKQKLFIQSGRDTTVPMEDFRIHNTLAQQGLTLESVLEKGRAVELLPNANLSSGGDAVDVTDVLHPTWHILAAKIATDMNLRYIGLDIMTEDSLAEVPNNYTVLEINSAAGLDNYAAMGGTQRARVEAMYKKVVEAMMK